MEREVRHHFRIPSAYFGVVHILLKLNLILDLHQVYFGVEDSESDLALSPEALGPFIHQKCQSRRDLMHPTLQEGALVLRGQTLMLLSGCNAGTAV